MTALYKLVIFFQTSFNSFVIHACDIFSNIHFILVAADIGSALGEAPTASHTQYIALIVQSIHIILSRHFWSGATHFAISSSIAVLNHPIFLSRTYVRVSDIARVLVASATIASILFVDGLHFQSVTMLSNVSCCSSGLLQYQDFSFARRPIA